MKTESLSPAPSEHAEHMDGVGTDPIHHPYPERLPNRSQDEILKSNRENVRTVAPSKLAQIARRGGAMPDTFGEITNNGTDVRELDSKKEQSDE